MRVSHLFAVCVGLSTLSAMGCGGGDDKASGKDGGAEKDAATDMSKAGHGGGMGGATNMNGSDAGLPMGKVHGRVFSAEDLSPLKAALVSNARGDKIKTDAKGAFVVDVLAGDDVMLATNASGFARGVTHVSVLPGGDAYAEITLVKVSAHAKLDAAKGGKLAGSSGESVTFPGGVFVTAAGAKVSGQVEVSLAPINPNDKLQMRAFPGTFNAQTKSGGGGLLETYVPMDISAVDAKGEPLTIAGGKKASVTFPVYDPATAPQKIALWSLDPDTGIWHEEGIAVRTLDGNGLPIYQATISHMSWWNCDAFRSELTCVRGCVEQDGKPAVGAGVLAEGIDYHVGGGGYTDDKGCFAQDVKIGGQISFRAVSVDVASEEKTITAGSADATAEKNPVQCQDIGTFTLKPVPKANDGCPGGFTLCGTQCVDLRSDPSHCGTCQLGCNGHSEGGGGIVHASCIAGKCECKSTQSVCNNSCTDFASDRYNCGKCGTVCETGDACDAGKCKPIVCGSGLTLCGNDCVDTDSNEANCGACNNACNGELGGGHTCSAGKCVCLPGTKACGQSCVDQDTDRNHCGDCNTVCETGTECTSGTCQDIVCTNSLTLCGNECVDTDTDNSHCGACDTTCPGEGGISCMGGVCKCPAGKTQCSQGCVNAASDRANCGGCGIICRTGFACVQSQCTQTQCAQNETLCGDSCANTNSDAMNCGACGNRCDAGLSCISGLCGCPAGKVACPNMASETSQGNFTCATTCAAAPTSCADVSGDYDMTGDAICPSQSCKLTQVGCTVFSSCCDQAGTVDDQGVLSLSCNAATVTCSFTIASGSVTGGCATQAGQCTVTGTSPACTSGQSLCNGSCTDMLSNAYSCGACGNVCNPDQTCEAGSCVNIPCQQGELFCGSGCTDPMTDDYNCGGCFISCSGNTPSCVGGVCSQ